MPALLFLVINAAQGPEVLRGWAIPVATDIAFALAVLSVVGTALPLALLERVIRDGDAAKLSLADEARRDVALVLARDASVPAPPVVPLTIASPTQVLAFGSPGFGMFQKRHASSPVEALNAARKPRAPGVPATPATTRSPAIIGAPVA